MKRHWVRSYPLSPQRWLWSDWTNAQADLSLCWAHSHFVSFFIWFHLFGIIVHPFLASLKVDTEHRSKTETHCQETETDSWREIIWMVRTKSSPKREKEETRKDVTYIVPNQIDSISRAVTVEGFINRNYVVWPTFFLMNVFIALKGSHFWFLWNWGCRFRPQVM